MSHRTQIVDGVVIDQALVPLIKVLWDNEIEVLESCQGSRREPASITFSQAEHAFEFYRLVVSMADLIMDDESFPRMESGYWNYDPEDPTLPTVCYSVVFPKSLIGSVTDSSYRWWQPWAVRSSCWNAQQTSTGSSRPDPEKAGISSQSLRQARR